MPELTIEDQKLEFQKKVAGAYNWGSIVRVPEKVARAYKKLPELTIGAH